MCWEKVSDPSGCARIVSPAAGAGCRLTIISPDGGSALQLAGLPTSAASRSITQVGGGGAGGVPDPSWQLKLTLTDRNSRLMLAWPLICHGSGPLIFPETVMPSSFCPLTVIVSEAAKSHSNPNGFRWMSTSNDSIPARLAGPASTASCALAPNCRVLEVTAK